MCTGVQLVKFTADASGNFLDCPKCKARFLGYAFTLQQVPRAVVSVPSAGGIAIKNLYKQESESVIYDDGEGGESQPIAGDMTYKELNAINQNAGQLNLTDTTWDISKAKIDYIRIEVVSGTVNDFDIGIYEKDTFQEADKRYAVEDLNSTDGWEDDLEWAYIDDDNTKEIHLEIIENSGSGSYNIQVRGTKLI